MRSLAILALATLATLTAGCESLRPGSSLGPQIAVQYAAGKFIESKTVPEARQDRAAKIKYVIEQVKAAAGSSEAVSVDSLQAIAQARVASATLNASDRLLAQALITAVATELKDRSVSGVLTPDKRVALNKVLDWIVTVTAAYGA